MGKAAFLEPLTCAVPWSGRPPWIINRSIRGAIRKCASITHQPPTPASTRRESIDSTPLGESDLKEAGVKEHGVQLASRFSLQPKLRTGSRLNGRFRFNRARRNRGWCWRFLELLMPDIKIGATCDSLNGQ